MLSNLYYVSPADNKFKCLSTEFDESVEEIHQLIATSEALPPDVFRLYQSGRPLTTTAESDVPIRVHLLLPGGKGGFGSMLRAIGAQIEKTTNREACRDLSGRRLRDINEEQRIKNWISKQANRKAEAAKRRKLAKEKLERLKALPKCEFQDPDYDRNRSEIPEIIDDALQHGLKAQNGQAACPSSSEPVISSVASTSSASSVVVLETSKRKAEEVLDKEEIKKKKHSLWLGFDLDEADLEDEDEEEGSDERKT